MEKAVYFICADDEFIADNRARELFAELSKDASDDMSKEVIQGSAGNANDAQKICAAAVEAACTMPLFGGRKVVWLRGLNFLNDSNGRSKDTQAALEEMAQTAASFKPENVAFLISASPVDKRKKAFKALKEISEFEFYESSNAAEACMELLNINAKKLGVELEYSAAQVLIETVAANPRMALQELEKLAAYAGFKGGITQKDVMELVPIFGEGNFFELVELYYAGNPEKSMAALRRYFFTNKNASARPILTNLQRQNSILIQLRSLIDEGKLPRTDRWLPKGAIESLAGEYAEVFKSEAKSAYNIFSQNPFLVNRLAPIASRTPMKKLISNQMDFIKAFEELIARGSNSDEQVMRELYSKA
ncbi:MAG: DNA polymerase III subunit delta [Opitutales bacterium]|nr:DNA polymerase III subunit delta [Opitutales bacterium]